MNRRIFLGSAGATFAAPGATRIPIAFLGGSHSHGFAKAKIAKESPDWDLVGVWEEDRAVRERYTAAGIPLISREQALAAGIKVVAVESDVKDHYQQALWALEAGKHVHVEKPPADTMEGMRKLVAMADRKKLLLQSGYMWRYHPGVNKAIEAARNGWLGEVYLVRGVINTMIDPERRPDWGIFKGGQMFELGSHLIDAVVRCLGRPDKVTPFLRQQGVHKDNLKDNTVAVFEYPRAMAVITSATLQPGAGNHRTFEILGTNGTATVRPIEPATLVMDLAKAAGPYAKGANKVALPAYTRYVDDLVELAAAVRGEKKLSMPLDQELLVQETLLRASDMI